MSADYFTSDDIVNMIKTHGIENIAVFAEMPLGGMITPLGVMTSSSDPKSVQLCKIQENNAGYSHSYKIAIESVESGFRDKFYTMDLAGLCRDIPKKFRVEVKPLGINWDDFKPKANLINPLGMF